MLFRAVAAALLLATQAIADVNVITITQHRSVCSATYTTGTASYTVVQSTITVSPVPYSDTAYNTQQVPFVIETTPDGNGTRSWLTYDGITTTNPALAGQYVIKNGQLYTVDGTEQVSYTPGGSGSQSFTVSSTPGPVTTGFTFTNGVLSWNNPAFPSGSGGFYTNGTTLIFSSTGQVPPGYYKVSIRAASSAAPLPGAGSTTVSTSIFMGSMSSAGLAGYSSPPGQYSGNVGASSSALPGLHSSSAPPFPYSPPAATLSSAAVASSSAGAPPGQYSPPPAYSLPAVTTSPSSTVVSSSAPAGPAGYPSPSSVPLNSLSLLPSASVTGGSSSARASSSAKIASASSTGPQLATVTAPNGPIGPNNPYQPGSSAATSSSGSSSMMMSTSSGVLIPVYSPPAYSPPAGYPTPSTSSMMSSMTSSSSSAMASASLPDEYPIGPNNPIFATSSTSSMASSTSMAASSSIGGAIPLSPPVVYPPGASSSSSMATSSSLAALPPAYTGPDLGATTSSSSSSSMVSPPPYTVVGLTMSSSSAPFLTPVSSSSSLSLGMPTGYAVPLSSSSSASSSSSSATAVPAGYPVSSSSTAAAATNTAPPAYSSTVPTCPSGDQTTFYDANGYTYQLFCSSDNSQTSYSNGRVTSYQACADLCDADATCTSATYSGPVGDGVCYLHRTGGMTVAGNTKQALLIKRAAPGQSYVASTSSSSATPASTASSSLAASTISTSSSSGAAAPTTSTTSTTTTSTTSASPYLYLPSPTPCDFDDPPNYPEDDSFCSVTLAFPLQIYNTQSTTVFASTNGFLSLMNGSSQYQSSKFPASQLPNDTMAMFFDDLYLYENTYPQQQGIWYQVQGSAVAFEYYLARAGDKSSIYHFTVTYDSTQPGSFRMKYYSIGTDTSGADVGINGAKAGVGMQGLSTSATSYYQYEYMSANSITPGMTLTCSTIGSNKCTTGTSLITISIG